MARKIALVLAALAIVSVANATITTNSLTAAAFDGSTAPSQYIFSNDTKWYNLDTVLATNVLWGPGSDNTTFYTYSPNVVTATTDTVTVTRKKVNASSFETITDDTISGGSTCDAGLEKYAAGTAAFGYACQLTATNKDLWVSFSNAGASSFNKLQITAETVSTNTNEAEGLWYDEGMSYWYVVYRTTDGTNILGLYIQAINATSGNNTAAYTSPVAIATYSSITTGSIVVNQVGSNNASSVASSSASVLIQDTSGTANVVKVFVLTLTASSATSSGTVLATDTSSGAGTTADPTLTGTYTPVGIFGAYNTFGAGVLLKNQSDDGTGATTTGQNLIIYYNGSATTKTMTTVDNTVTAATITGTNYGDGYIIINSQTGASAVTYSYQAYFDNGTTNGTAGSMGTVGGRAGFWLDGNGSLWFGVVDYTDTAITGPPSITANAVQDAYAGKLIGQVFLFANTLSSVFAFVALMIAAIFAF